MTRLLRLKPSPDRQPSEEGRHWGAGVVLHLMTQAEVNTHTQTAQLNHNSWQMLQNTGRNSWRM